MKGKFTRYAILLGLLMMGGVVSCASTTINTPQDAIVDAYGDRQFRISFDSTNLDAPLSDIYYTAKNMPVLPTPNKVGYVFAGWYFDASLTQPCNVDAGDLLWKMKNLTLYPKWEQEEIVNNGQYDIEFEAHIIEDSIAKGPLANKYGYQKFDEDIITEETYIEKNAYGKFLRIQYDCQVRGPIFGGDGADSDNFSKQTYTVSDKDNRISKELSILDRTSTIQTIYYDINGLNFADPIVLNIEYYNWDGDIPEKQRAEASVMYDVEFNITKFIGFGSSFINPESKLEDGVYLIPSHYGKLDKNPSMLDAFNPVYAYIKANDGNYTLYKPMNAYNSDFPAITPNEYPLRSTGYAREFACFTVDKNLKLPTGIEEDMTGKYYIPKELNAEKFLPLTYEFHADTGRYYYVIDLGKTLDKDVVFIGGSTGFMESMASLPVNYRRLSFVYNSMVRLADWDYKPLTGPKYSYREDAAFYPGSKVDFEGNNLDFDIYQKYRSAIRLTNVFFTQTKYGRKPYDTKVTITPKYGSYIKNDRYRYQYFDMQMDAYGYDPLIDGQLYSRDYSFVTNNMLNFANSSVNEIYNGKTFEIGDSVDLDNIYREKIFNSPEMYKYHAYEVDDKLNINFNKEVSISKKFKFSQNIAVYFETEGNNKRMGLVYIIERQAPKIAVANKWQQNSDGIYVSEDRFEIGKEVTVPEIQYSFYGKGYSNRGLIKDDTLPNKTYTDFTKVLVWDYSQDLYTSKIQFAGDPSDFIMDSEKVRVQVQLVNPFNEFTNVMFELKGVNSGEYEIKSDTGESLSKGDLEYEGSVRKQINYEVDSAYNIYKEEDVNNLPRKFELSISTDISFNKYDANFDFAIVYLQSKSVKAQSFEELWSIIKDEPYAVIYNYYKTPFGDTVVAKAQFNFKIEGKNLDGYKLVKGTQTVFTNKSFIIATPYITNDQFDKLAKSEIKVYRQIGSNYIESYEDVRLYNHPYSVDVQFKKAGNYIIKMKFDFIRDEYGNQVFKTEDINDESNRVQMNISQKITVYDVNSEINFTYATPLDHPFNMDCPETEGFTLTSDENYQYLTKKLDTKVENFALSSAAYINPNNDFLYAYKNKNGQIQVQPQYLIKNIHVEQQTLNPVIYACFDKGFAPKVYYEVDGKEYYYKTSKKIMKSQGSDSYLVRFNNFAVTLPDELILQGYREVWGFRASEDIFKEEIKINGETKNIYTNTRKDGYGFNLNVGNPFDKITVIFKLKTYITYDAYDEQGNELEFMKKVSNDYGLYVGDEFIKAISKKKFDELSDIYCKDTSMNFKYWAAYNKETKEYEKIDLNTFKLDKQYYEKDGIKLRAIFGK